MKTVMKKWNSLLLSRRIAIVAVLALVLIIGTVTLVTSGDLRTTIEMVGFSGSCIALAPVGGIEDPDLGSEDLTTPEEIAAKINKKFDSYNKLLEKTAKASDLKDAKATLFLEIKALADRLTTKESENTALTEKLTNLEEILKGQGVSITNLKTVFDPKSNKKSFRDVVYKSLEDGAFKDLLEKKSRDGSITIDLKLVTFDGVNGSGAATQPVMPFKIPTFTPEEDFDIRTFIPTGQSDSDKLEYPREYSFTDNTGMLAENADITESDMEFEMVEVSGRRIAALIKVSRKALKNISWLADHISSRLMARFVKKLNAQVIAGDATGYNLDGLVKNATQFTPGDLEHTFENANELDVFIAARARNYQVNLIKPNVVFLNPLDAARLYSLKSTIKDYVNREPYMTVDTNGLVRISGMPIIESFNIGVGAYLMANTNRQYMELLFNGPIEIRSTDSNEDDFRKNKIAINLEAEVLLPIYHTGALIKGTIADDFTAINKQ